MEVCDKEPGTILFKERKVMSQVSVVETIKKVANGVALQFLLEEELRCIRYFFGDDDIYAKASLFIKRLEHGKCVTGNPEPQRV